MLRASGVARGAPAKIVTAPRLVPTEPRPQTHRAARLARLPKGDRAKTAVFVNAESVAAEEFAGTRRKFAETAELPASFLAANVVWNEAAAPREASGLLVGWLASSTDANCVHNFTPLRPIQASHSGSLIDRAARETPFESRFDLLTRLRSPEFCRESAGTPRRDYQEGVVQGVRMRAVQNPYYTPNRRELRQFNLWRSRHWTGPDGHWSPHNVSVRGGRKQFSIPEAIFPTKDELGEAHPPLLSARYVADVKKQFIMHGLPWLYDKNFGKVQVHLRDRPPKIRKRWIRRDLRLAKIHQAMQNMGALVAEHRKDKRAAKPNNWFENVVNEIAGEQVASVWVRKPKAVKG